MAPAKQQAGISSKKAGSGRGGRIRAAGKKTKKKYIWGWFPVGEKDPIAWARKAAAAPILYETVLRLNIEVLGSEPIIWRRIEIPDNLNFKELHHAIQDAMHGWMGSHAYQFKFPGEVFIMNQGSFDCYGRESTHGSNFLDSETQVKDYFDAVGKVGIYEYDFGDSWDHKITLEKISRPISSMYPRVVDGYGACPIEDAGGIVGYMEKLAILKNRRHPEFKQVKEWVQSQTEIQRDGKAKFDPAYFNKSSVHFRNGKGNGVGEGQCSSQSQ